MVTCSKCRYWVPDEENFGVGECCRKAPSVVPDAIWQPSEDEKDRKIAQYTYATVWPDAKASEWCGEGLEKR